MVDVVEYLSMEKPRPNAHLMLIAPCSWFSWQVAGIRCRQQVLVAGSSEIEHEKEGMLFDSTF